MTVCLSMIAIGALIGSCIPATRVMAGPCRPQQAGPRSMVIGFAGWTLPMTSHHGSAVDQITERLRARGLDAEVYPPSEWPSVAERLIASREASRSLVLVGFSMGAAAAIHVAQKLGSVGVPVRAVVLVEAWNPEPVPANVAEATHYYSTGFASAIRPGPGNTNTVDNIDLNGSVPGIGDVSHVGMSRMTAVQDLVTDRILKAAMQDAGGTRGGEGAARSAKKRRKSLPACPETSAASLH